MITQMPTVEEVDSTRATAAARRAPDRVGRAPRSGARDERLSPTRGTAIPRGWAAEFSPQRVCL